MQNSYGGVVQVQTRPIASPYFDEDRLAALLKMAGPETAKELTLRLDEDLSRVGRALNEVGVQLDHAALQAQSHILLSIAGTIGASHLFDLSKQLNGVARAGTTADSHGLADLLQAIRAGLHDVLGRVRAARFDLIQSR